MNTRYVIAITALGAALFAVPVAAHHNCVAPECPDEVEDAMGMHETAIEGLDMDTSGSQSMTTTTAEEVNPLDPADAAAGDSSGTQAPTQSGWAP